MATARWRGLLVAGGAMVVVAVTFAVRVSSPRLTAPARTATSVAPDASPLEQRVAALEREVQTLRRELQAQQPASLGTSARLDAAEGFDRRVRAVLAQERAAEHLDLKERRVDFLQARADNALAELHARLALTDDQYEQLAALWRAEAAELADRIQAAQSGDDDFADVHEQLERIRHDTDDEAIKVLTTAAERTAYSEMRPRGPQPEAP